MIILTIIMYVVACLTFIMGLACLICSLEESEFIYGTIILWIICFAVLYITPVSEKITRDNNVAGYYTLVEKDDHYIVVDNTKGRRSMDAHDEYDIRFIKAAKEKRLYVEISQFYNIFGKGCGCSAYLKY